MKFLSMFLIGMLSLIYGSFLLVIMWSWFIVPFGIMQINVAHAIGLTTIKSLLTIKFQEQQEISFKQFVINIITVSITETVLFGIGFLAHLYM